MERKGQGKELKLSMGIGFPLVFLPITVLGTNVHRWARRAMQRVSIISSKMHENITCIRVVKAYNTEALEEKKYQTANRDYVKTLLRSVRIELLIQPVVEALGVCMIFIFIIYCFFTKVAIYDIVPLVAPLLVAYRPMRQLSKEVVLLSVLDEGELCSHAISTGLHEVLDFLFAFHDEAHGHRLHTTGGE